MKIRFNYADQVRQKARTWRDCRTCLAAFIVLWYNLRREVIDMQLEDYFDFFTPNDIRIKGSRVGIESVLYDYIYREQTPQEIQQHFPTLTLEEIQATILYYLHNREQVEKYITEWLEWGDQMRAEQDRNPPPVIIRLRALKAERAKMAMAQAQ